MRRHSFDIEFEGARLHWSLYGHGARTVVLVHGWACNETVWRSQTELRSDYQVVTIDLPGHGESNAPACGKLSLDLFARAVEAVRVEIGAERMALVGHSLGTPVALRYVKRFPGHVGALVFAEGIVSQRRAPTFAPERLIGPAGKEVFEKIIRTTLISPSTTSEIADLVLSIMLSASETTIVGVAQAMLDPSAWDDDQVNLPVLGVYSDRSLLVNWKTAMQRFPALTRMEIDDAGHFLMLEKPAEFNKMLVEFLDRQSL